MRILVSGMVAGDPGQGGASWAVLQYVLGLEKLGHEVMFVEPISVGRVAAAEPYFRLVLSESGLKRAALIFGDERRTIGPDYEDVRAWAARADMLLNLAGLLTDEELLESIPVRVYVDLDPAFTQFWHAAGIEMRFAGHTHHVTLGQSLGKPGCPIPSCGIDWIPTVPPIVLERWPMAETITHDALTTVGNWRSYGSLEHDGVFYGQKAHSLREVIELPTRTDERLLLALAIDRRESADLAELARQKWELVDPVRVAGTPAAYATFIRTSKAEFGIAKSGYVTSRSGWFSDRSVCYLASGRPVVAQDTGFEGFIGAGDGLLPFATIDEAVAAIDDLRRNYARHARGARRLAEQYFDSDRVLTTLLERVGVA
jgi:hypothetical protein